MFLVCYPMLMMILAFGSIAECHPTTTMKNNQRPVPYFYCSDPQLYRVHVKCFYSVVFGKPETGDKLIKHANYCGGGRIGSFSASRTVTIEFPGKDQANELIITEIFMEYPRGERGIWDEKISIIEGGIGQKRFKMSIERDDPDRSEECHTVSIYGRESK